MNNKDKVEILGQHYHNMENGGLVITVEETTTVGGIRFTNLEVVFSHLGNESKISCTDIGAESLRGSLHV
jgi:hypothetical protein